MPIAMIIFGVDVACIVHAAKTGRFWPWAYVVLFLPGVGAAAYIVIEILPAWLGSYSGQRARQQVISKVDPERLYRTLLHNLEIADTLANREALARECLNLQKFDEALAQYDHILADRLGDEPRYFQLKAKSLIGLGRPEEAVETLDALRERWPDYQSQEGHLTYARALEAAGRDGEALDEYEALASYYAGAEPRARRAALLERLGRDAEAKEAAQEIVKALRRGSPHVRKLQAEWLRMAEQVLKENPARRV